MSAGLTLPPATALRTYSHYNFLAANVHGQLFFSKLALDCFISFCLENRRFVRCGFHFLRATARGPQLQGTTTMAISAPQTPSGKKGKLNNCHGALLYSENSDEMLKTTHSSWPDFGVLVCAVITMEDGVTHAATKPNLLGPNLTVAQTESLTECTTQSRSTWAIVSHPFFIYHFKDDEVCPVENALCLDRALTAAEVREGGEVKMHGGNTTELLFVFVH
jgi:hypothetical protein